MKKYLLDTNICIYFLKGQFDLHDKIKNFGEENCFLSEITIAELKYGAENSIQKEKNKQNLKAFQAKFDILPIFPALDIYAKEKARLKTKGKILDDFDLLIGATAIFNNLTLVTRNISDFDRLNEIIIEDWTTSDTTYLFRPVNQAELDLIKQSGWARFPPRLPEQPIFYPVMNEDYAIQISKEWNVPAYGVGYVTKFAVKTEYLKKFKVENVGGEIHDELWIPAGELEEFNSNIVGQIEVTKEFRK